MNLTLRGGGWPFGLEKWYVDVLGPQGEVLLIYLVRARLGGVPMSRVTAELFLPGQEPIRGQGVARGVRGGEDQLSFGPASILGDSLAFKTPGLSGELVWSPRAQPVALREPFLERDGRSLTWQVEIPDASVEASLRWPEGGMDLLGRGYRDRVWMDLPPWDFPIRELLWGRGVTTHHATTWVSARTDEGVVAARWQDGQLVEPTPPELGPPRVLLETRVADIEGLALGWLQGPLRRISGDPHEVKWAASVRLGEEEGVAIHERVVWGS